MFKTQAEQAISYVGTASDIAKSFGFFGAAAKKLSSPAASTDRLALTAPPPPPASNSSAQGWARWAPAVGGALLAAGAAGAAYYRRDDLAEGWKWGNDHMKYVGTLWDEKALHARLARLAAIRDELGVRFCVFYTVLDAAAPRGETRTFCVLPKKGSREASFWAPTHNKLAQDEVNAHISMFEPKVNDGYYDLGLRTVHVSRRAGVLHGTLTCAVWVRVDCAGRDARWECGCFSAESGQRVDDERVLYELLLYVTIRVAKTAI